MNYEHKIQVNLMINVFVVKIVNKINKFLVSFNNNDLNHFKNKS